VAFFCQVVCSRSASAVRLVVEGADHDLGFIDAPQLAALIDRLLGLR
jgi:hypothetical protein